MPTSAQINLSFTGSQIVFHQLKECTNISGSDAPHYMSTLFHSAYFDQFCCSPGFEYVHNKWRRHKGFIYPICNMNFSVLIDTKALGLDMGVDACRGHQLSSRVLHFEKALSCALRHHKLSFPTMIYVRMNSRVYIVITSFIICVDHYPEFSTDLKCLSSCEMESSQFWTATPT
jgi:hypothetical protein